MSCETLRPLPRLEIVEALVRGFRAALMLPSGVDDGVILAVAADVETERGVGRPCVGEEGARLGLASGEATGDDGEGEPKGLSESKSSLGVEAAEAMAWTRTGRDAAKDKSMSEAPRPCDGQGEFWTDVEVVVNGDALVVDGKP